MCWFFSVATIFCNNFMLPKRLFWKDDPAFQNALSKHFSTFASQSVL